MGLARRFLRDRGYSMTLELVAQCGFSGEEARAFLPAAVRSCLAAFQGSPLDVSSVLGRGEAGALLARVDLDGLTLAAGIGRDQAKSGLSAVLPQLLESMKREPDEQGPPGGAMRAGESVD